MLNCSKPYVSRAKHIALAFLILWTVAHLALWGLGHEERTLEQDRGNVRGVRIGALYSGFWPFPGTKHRPVSGKEEPTASFAPAAYDLSEFIAYVGGAWAIFGAVCILTMRGKG